VLGEQAVRKKGVAGQAANRIPGVGVPPGWTSRNPRTKKPTS
jgi:hypothetical protein